MPHMTIMRGGPGSGKSWFVRNLVPLSISPVPPTVCSADDFFINDEGEYSFDPKWLGRAHGACLKKCVEAIMRREDVIIDNTNSKQEEMLPYLALCQAFDYSCAVVRVLCDPEVAWGRQKHGLPRDKFDDIHTTVRQQQVPKLYRGAPWLIIKDREQIGKIVAAGDMPPDLYDSDGNGVTITSGTLLRLTDWTPHRPGFKAGNYWTVETLDGLYHGSQVYDYELSQPGVLDKLWIAQKEPDGPGS